MNEELLRAIQENQRWLAQFNRREYAGAFQTYVKQYGPRYMAAVQSAGEGALPAMAAALLDHLETGWLACRPGRRAAARGTLSISHAAGIGRTGMPAPCGAAERGMESPPPRGFL